MAASSRPCRQLAAQLRWCGGAAGEALPLVVIVDMENSDGSIYKGDEPDLIERDELAGVAEVVYTGADSIEDIDPALLAQAVGVLLRRCPFGAPQLAALPQLKSIVRMGAGYDNVDIPATQAAGVVASNCPDAWVEEVADHALGLLLALYRRTLHLVETASAGGWTRQANLQQQKMKRIRGQRLGVVGVGRIGTAVILRAKAFGFALSIYDPGLPSPGR